MITSIRFYLQSIKKLKIKIISLEDKMEKQKLAEMVMQKMKERKEQE